jgi:cellulose synthase/poly-beta-1,6-N-acetylglucosamine synthase-like glycosyltransferase
VSEAARVVVVMPVINEERHLRDSVLRLLEQDYQGPLDIVIAVGPSRDATHAIAEQISIEHANVHVVENPSGKTPTGLNAAITFMDSDIVVRVDGHAMVSSDYVRTGVETLTSTGADNVGGIMDAEGSTPTESAIAAAMKSAFGVGGAAFHIGGEAGPALTVYLGCFQRSALDRVGGYDETMVRAQDWEMNYRIRQSGGQVWFTPMMRVSYRPRPTLRALARQYHDYGRWRREVARRHPDTVSLRYLAAPLTVVGVGTGLVLAVVGLTTGTTWLTALGIAAPAVYVAGNLVASAHTTLRYKLAPTSAMLLPAVFATMHGAWGTGFLRGVRG